MKNIIISAVTSIIVVVIALVLVGGNQSVSLGGTTNLDALTLDNGNLTISNGSLLQTTSNTATSTTKVGCIQTTATSTQTPVRLVIGSSGATTTYTGALSTGVVGWQYGNCPI